MGYWKNLVTKRTGFKQAEHGFTIIEISVVLAVTGLMIVYALAYVLNKPANARFHTSIGDFQTSVEQIINQTTNGQYINNSNYSCTPGSASHPTISTLSSANQGTNYGCVFLGKIIQFNPNSGTASPTQYIVYPVVGNQYYSGSITDTIAHSYPYLVSNDSQTTTIESGLKVVSVYALNSTGTKISTTAIGVLAGDASGNLLTTSGSDLNSGPEPSSLYFDNKSSFNPGISTSTLSGDVSDTSTSANTDFQYASQVTICIANSTKSASLQIGENGGLNDTLRVWGNTTCS